MLMVRPGEALDERTVADLPDLLRAGDVLVVNDTRVIPARLSGVRRRDEGEVRVEATLHRRLAPDRWSAFARPGKRLRAGDRVSFGAADGVTCGLEATVADKGEGGEVTLAFDLASAALDQAVALHGLMPLPPYIAAKRGEDERDRADYQTVYAAHDGSVAAPTAGLHFTPELLDRLRHKGITVAAVRLDVGLGTFRPIRTEDVDAHEMHAEAFEVPEETARAVNACRGRVVAVGTTTLRALESAALEAENGTAAGRVCAARGETRLFIRPAGGGHPGHRFRAVDALITNFHQPHSTLLLLVAAFAGRTTSASAGPEHLRRAYATALAEGYRFLSFGDAMLLH